MKQENKDQQAMSFADKYEEGYKAGVYDTKRKQWKPSEEQMEALSDAWLACDDKEKCELLSSLYDDLKKRM